MVAKHNAFGQYMKNELSSSKNPYGSKTAVCVAVSILLLSSSKNPYGSKTDILCHNLFILLSSSKNPYGSKTGTLNALTSAIVIF